MEGGRADMDVCASVNGNEVEAVAMFVGWGEAFRRGQW